MFASALLAIGVVSLTASFLALAVITLILRRTPAQEPDGADTELGSYDPDRPITYRGRPVDWADMSCTSFPTRRAK